MVDARTRPLVDIAAEVLADDAQRIGISYTGFCLTALPHKRLPDEQPWEKKGHRVTLLVEPGRLKHGGKIKLFGVPYGARARMILLYLQTQAIRTQSREVALGRSMRDWMERMGLAIGGETAHALREQAARISACSLKFFWEDAGSDGFERGAIVRSGLRFQAEDSTQVCFGKTELCWTKLSTRRFGITPCLCWRLRSASSGIAQCPLISMSGLHGAAIRLESQLPFRGRQSMRSLVPAIRQSASSNRGSPKH
jgi:hypothetical protein